MTRRIPVSRRNRSEIRPDPPAVTVACPIIIQLETGISGAQVYDRFDMVIRGQAFSAESIAGVRLETDGRVIGAALFGQCGSSLAEDDRPGVRSFQFNLPCRAAADARRCDFQIVAPFHKRLESTEKYQLDIETSRGDAVAIGLGATRSQDAAAPRPPFIIMCIERGTLDADGKLSVNGWATSLMPILSVRIHAGDAAVADATSGGQRDDVASVFTGYPNAGQSGFSLTALLDNARLGAEHIHAEVVCADGFTLRQSIPVERLTPDAAAVLPACVITPPAISPADIHLFCDVAELTGDGTLSLSGWAVCGIGLARVRVLVDGVEAGLATFGHPRPDVGDLFPEIPMAGLAGFVFDRCIGGTYTGQHEVRIDVHNTRGDEYKSHIVVAATVRATSPELVPGHPGEFRFELDAPVVSNDAAVALINGRLTIEGWLLTRSGIASFEVLLDDQHLGNVLHGLARQDVGAAFADWPNAVRSGFAFHCPPRSLSDGAHVVNLRIRANNGESLNRSFRITVRRTRDQQDLIGIRRRMPRGETDMMLAFLTGLDYRPSFRFILRPDRSVDRVRLTLDALRSQVYPDWRAHVLAEDDDIAADLGAMMGDEDSRVSVTSPSDELAWAAPLAMTEDALYGLLLAGDEPGADALLELAVASGRHRQRDFLYSDEVRLSPVSGEREPFFKPDFSPDLLLSTNYIGRLWVATGALLVKTGATPASLTAHGEYDLVCRCTELAASVHHIPRLLCQRGAAELDGPNLEKAALARAMMRRDIAGEILPASITGTWRVKRVVPPKGKVSIIIPTCAAQGHIEACITSLRAKTAYSDYEIICIDNIPEAGVAWKVWLRQHADKVLELTEVFNWSRFNNLASALADGEYLLFLNDDTEIIQEDWLAAMLEHAQRGEVGITGAQLLYRDGKVQHAGMFLGQNGTGRHAFRFAGNDDPCYFGLALTQRNVSAVTGACMLVRRDTFDRLGGFDEAHEIVNNDLDFCLRAQQAGLLTVFTPYATLNHYELASRAGMTDRFDMMHFNGAWRTAFAAGDRYFNPRLSRHADDYRPDDEPLQWVVAGAPLFQPTDIKRILVVKLDHIGDFVTALPPIRRLKKLFPHALITVLAGPASRAFIAMEPCIDAFIPFAFFHARSELGEQTLTGEDYAALAEQLRTHRFDLAVDLRKHPSTRDVLLHTGARCLAGFDHAGQFPFLDIAIDWDGDRSLRRKRSHVVDDLMGLVNAIGYASEADRTLMQPTPPAMNLSGLPEHVQALFSKPVVAIHPGAGNVTKQWPEEHFSALIDLLVEKNDVNILLVGGPDDVRIASALLSGALHPAAIASLAGETALADLPGLLKSCALYIGNDSGPKHIAAAAGIPTIGIHSGVVDPVEWGPIGANAIALRRNMTCSPCYLAKAEDCPRSLACLRLLDPSVVYEAADLFLHCAPPPAKFRRSRQRQPAREPA